MTTYRVVDVNGDQDGYPDTNETVDLHLTIANKSWLFDVTNLVVIVSTTDPKIDCLTPASVTIASLPARAEIELPFRIHIRPEADRAGPTVRCQAPGPGGVCSNFVARPGGCVSDSDCRVTAQQDYSASFEVFTSGRKSSIVLDLDLDATNAPGPTTTFTESFEAPFGFGSFTFQNLDVDKATNALSDGYRCQYSDPDFVNSNSYGQTYCYLGFASGQTISNDWHVHTTAAPDGGRAHVGGKSLHYGVHFIPFEPPLDTYGLSQLDAIATRDPVRLAARVCRDDPSANKRACGTAEDCLGAGGGPCVPANPELSFKHQVSTMDSRRAGVAPGTTVDRAVVQVQPSGSVWQKIFPYRNVYDALANEQFSNCLFDPIDDGNTEDSYFDPTDPARRLGPSSTCYPEHVFNYLGDTDDPFDPSNIGRASDGPGLPGSLGPGTWVESRFDLTRYRGRAIKLRFLFTSIKADDAETMEGRFGFNPTPEDDGWYIDDVRLTQSLGAASAVVTTDDNDNSALPGNVDGDARADACDCAPTDPGTFARPDIRALRFGSDKQTLVWDSAVVFAGTASVHDVMRGAIDELPVGVGASETCLASGIAAATLADATVPATGRGLYYLVRGVNACSTGEWGLRSDGTGRISAACP